MQVTERLEVSLMERIMKEAMKETTKEPTLYSEELFGFVSVTLPERFKNKKNGALEFQQAVGGIVQHGFGGILGDLLSAYRLSGAPSNALNAKKMLKYPDGMSVGASLTSYISMYFNVKPTVFIPVEEKSYYDEVIEEYKRVQQSGEEMYLFVRYHDKETPVLSEMRIFSLSESVESLMYEGEVRYHTSL